MNIKSNMDYVSQSDILKALAHPVRLRIVAGLVDGTECNVNAMVEKLGVPQSTVSQHLTVLRHQGILTCRKKGLETCYFLADERIKKIIDSLS